MKVELTLANNKNLGYYLRNPDHHPHRRNGCLHLYIKQDFLEGNNHAPDPAGKKCIRGDYRY